jgi:hypothetical protein
MEGIVRKITRTLPQKESDLNTVAKDVAAVWATRPEISLVWTGVEQFQQSIGLFGTSYAERADMRGIRRGVTQNLKMLNREINLGTEHLKNYLTEQYSRNTARVHYESVGITKVGSGYQLPADNDSRLYAIEQLLKGLEEHDLNDRKYGLAYWKDLHTRFAAAKAQASEADRTSTSHVSVKAEQKKQIRKTLNALIYVIKGNYPETWREELRVWGFQKDKY